MNETFSRIVRCELVREINNQFEVALYPVPEIISTRIGVRSAFGYFSQYHRFHVFKATNCLSFYPSQEKDEKWTKEWYPIKLKHNQDFGWLALNDQWQMKSNGIMHTSKRTSYSQEGICGFAGIVPFLDKCVPRSTI